ncbi:MAG: hypothetical protein RML36_16840, partial [Anaerolineae bacterium]|nr:hypothetical protein [Anaerolineae bacterium]
RVGDRVYFREPLPDITALEDAVLVREVAPMAAEEAVLEPTPGAMPFPERAPAGMRTVAEPGGVFPATAVVGAYVLRARVAWDKLADFVRGVVTPLQREADLEIEVSLKAHGRSGGIRRGILEQVVKETLQQIRAEILEEFIEETPSAR